MPYKKVRGKLIYYVPYRGNPKGKYKFTWEKYGSSGMMGIVRYATDSKEKAADYKDRTEKRPGFIRWKEAPGRI